MEGISLQTIWWVGALLGGMVAGAGLVLGLGWRIYTSVSARIEKLESDMAEYREYVAEHYALKVGVSHSVDDLKDSMNKFSDKFDRGMSSMTQRIDTLIGTLLKPGQ